MITQIFLPIIFTIGTALPFTPVLPDACPAEPAELSVAWNEDHTGAILCTPPGYTHDPASFELYEDGSARWLTFDEPTGLWMSSSACIAPEMGCTPD